MKDLSTIPLSVRQQLERAEKQAQEILPMDTQAALQRGLQEAFAELAKQDPALCGLLFVSMLGKSSITSTETVIDKRTVSTAKKVLGVTYGVDETTTTDTRMRTRKISF